MPTDFRWLALICDQIFPSRFKFRKPLEEILNKHNINFLLIDKNYAGLKELNLSRIEIFLEAGNLCLLKW